MSILSFYAPRTTKIYTFSLHDALPIFERDLSRAAGHVSLGGSLLPERVAPRVASAPVAAIAFKSGDTVRSEEHTSELQSRLHLVCRLLLEKKKLKMNPCLTHLSQPLLP